MYLKMKKVKAKTKIFRKENLTKLVKSFQICKVLKLFYGGGGRGAGLSKIVGHHGWQTTKN